MREFFEEERGYLSVMHAGAGQKRQKKKKKKKKKATRVIPTISLTSAIDIFGSSSQSETPADSSESSVMPLQQSDMFCHPQIPRKDGEFLPFLLVSRPKSALDQLVESNHRVAHRRPPFDVVD